MIEYLKLRVSYSYVKKIIIKKSLDNQMFVLFNLIKLKFVFSKMQCIIRTKHIKKKKKKCNQGCDKRENTLKI